jgi:hypothetical protein
MARKARIVVEGYERIEERARSPFCRYDIIILAECSHGNPNPKAVYKQAARIGVRYWWGAAHEMAAIQACVFFKPGDKEIRHGLVESIT